MADLEVLLTCSKCGTMCQTSEFYLDARYRSGYNPRCKSCKADDSLKSYYKDHEQSKRRLRDRSRGKYPKPPEARRATRLKSHGVDSAWYDSMVARHGGCMVCGSGDPGMRHSSFAIDHDHNCCPGPTNCPACVRGILCHDCNVTLGKMNDDPALLRRAADYLEAHRAIA